MENSPPSELNSVSTATESAIADLSEGDILRIELYEEVPRLNREIVVKEKIQIKKVLTQASADVQP